MTSQPHADLIVLCDRASARVQPLLLNSGAGWPGRSTSATVKPWTLDPLDETEAIDGEPLREVAMGYGGAQGTSLRVGAGSTALGVDRGH